MPLKTAIPIILYFIVFQYFKLVIQFDYSCQNDAQKLKICHYFNRFELVS